MTCERIVSAVTGTSHTPVAVTWTSHIPVAVGCCDDTTPYVEPTLVSWIPVDEEIKAAALDPWDGVSFIGPQDVFRAILTSGGGGGGGGTFTQAESSSSPSDVTDDGGGGINWQ